MPESKDSEQRRNEFMEAAERLFRKNGIVDTTVNSIVKEMNVSKGLFYYYFNSKDDVIEAIREKYSQAFNAMMQQSLDQQNYPDKLAKFIDNSVDSFRKLIDSRQGDSDDVDLTQLSVRSIDEAKEAAAEKLQELLEEGNKLGEHHIKRAEYLADILIGGIVNIAEKGEATAEEIKEIITDLIDQAGKE